MAKYRRLRQGDVRAMLDLWKECDLFVREKGRDSPRRLRAEMKENPGGFIGAFEGDELVGVILATSDGRKGWINRLAVSPRHRRKGIGLVLIRKAEKELSRRGMILLTALIDEGNKESFTLFEKAGYDTRRDIVYMRKELKKDA